MAGRIHGNQSSGFELMFSCPDCSHNGIADRGWKDVLAAHLDDAGPSVRNAASSMPKSRSCVRTMQLPTAAQSGFRIGRRGSRTVDQWIAPKPWAPRQGTGTSCSRQRHFNLFDSPRSV